ncbi:MAG: murein biosynthesis integral membrane protein MurJ [Alphaproteobacteria bacterium]|nr:murein biosynthesis integral membrane protein MurJ [Alphaproteobacteria bacterium]
MSLFKSIATFGSFTLLSRFAGFIRDVVIAKYLGAGMFSDAFLVSFKLPNLFRSLFAEGAFNTSFVPLLSHKMVEDGKDKSTFFASRALSILFFILAFFSLIVMIFMPIAVKIMAPGFIKDPEKLNLTITLSRITFPYLLLVSMVSFQSGILNSLGKFAAPAATPIILNVVMTLSVFVFMPFTPSPAYSLAIGVTTAGFLQVLWLMYFIRKENYQLRPQFDIFNILKDKEIKLLFRRIAPGIIGAGIYQVNIMVGTILVSMLQTGAISWLYYADRLQQVPLGVVGAAIGVALLPVLSQQLKKDDIQQAKRTQDKAIEYGAVLAIPAATILIVLSFSIINVLFERGAFGVLETEMTGQALIAYVIGLPAYVMVKALAPNFFARGDTKTPVKYSIVSLVSNLILSICLIVPFKHVGVAVATSIVAYITLAQYIWGLRKRGHWSFSSNLILQIIKIVLCSLTMGIVLFLAHQFFNHTIPLWLNLGFIKKLFILGTIVILGVATFLIMAKIMKVNCVNELIAMIPQKRRKR